MSVGPPQTEAEVLVILASYRKSDILFLICINKFRKGRDCRLSEIPSSQRSEGAGVPLPDPLGREVLIIETGGSDHGIEIPLPTAVKNVSLSPTRANCSAARAKMTSGGHEPRVDGGRECRCSTELPAMTI